MAEIHGSCDDRFEGLRGILSENIDSGQDLGLSAAVTIDGEFVADLWGG